MISFKSIPRWAALGSLVSALVGALPAWAVEPFTLRDIRVEGLQRVEPGTIFASLPFRVGETYNDAKGSSAIRALFGLGLFSDVRLEVNGEVLVVIVEERPSVAEVSFSGFKEFDDDVLKKAMRDVGLTEGRPFDKALADRAEQEIKRLYLSRSLYAAQVTTTVTPIDRNRVNLQFHVVEGDVAKISEIRIVGNQAFPESDLLDLFSLDTGGWLGWYTKSDRYSREKLNADLETLKSYYLNRGFLEFRVESTQVAIAPEKDDIGITINVTEGTRFVVSGVTLEGDYLAKEAEFQSLVTIAPGEAYNAEQVADTTRAFQDYFGTFGYAFARVEAVPKVDRERGSVTIALRANPSRRVYVRRIDLEGNNRTRDEVIRREFRQLEAAWFDSDRIRLSRDRVDRLGFFTEVNVDTQDVPNAPDQVDLVVRVTEKPTGNIQIGAGYSQSEKLSLLAGIQQENVFGSGNYLGLNVNTSNYNRQFVLTTVDPYFTRDGISRTLDVYYRTTRPLDEQGGDYRIVNPGASVRFGVPFTETDTVYFGVGVERTTVEDGAQLPLAYVGEGGTAVPLTVGWSRDTRDSSLVPSRGYLHRANGEWGVAGDSRYVKASYQFQQYFPLTKQYTLAVNAEAGWGKGLGGRGFPVFKNFFGGGLGSVRGFEQNTLGESTATTTDPTAQVFVGGNKKVLLNAEIIAPFPGAGNDRTLRMFAFMDVGNVVGPSQSLNFSDLRASVGVGLNWITPIGPLKLVFPRAIRKDALDRTQGFHFQIGTSF